MSAIGTRGGTLIYYNGWGRGNPVGAPHGVCTTHKVGAKEKRLASHEA
jgi:hypothetical protein